MQQAKRVILAFVCEELRRKCPPGQSVCVCEILIYHVESCLLGGTADAWSVAPVAFVIVVIAGV